MAAGGGQQTEREPATITRADDAGNGMCGPAAAITRLQPFCRSYLLRQQIIIYGVGRHETKLGNFVSTSSAYVDDITPTKRLAKYRYVTRKLARD